MKIFMAYLGYYTRFDRSMLSIRHLIQMKDLQIRGNIVNISCFVRPRDLCYILKDIPYPPDTL